MTNQELLAKIEEWVDDHEDYVCGDEVGNGLFMIESKSLITFIKKLLHE